MKLARAREFVEAIAAHDFDAAEELLDPDVETVTPRDTFRGIAACRRVLQKASGDEQFMMEQAAPELEDVEGDVLARTHEIARWRETGEVAYEREVAALDARRRENRQGRRDARRGAAHAGGVTAAGLLAGAARPTSDRIVSITRAPKIV